MLESGPDAFRGGSRFQPPTFGFLDLGAVRQSHVLGVDVRATIDAVRCADELGFERYWIAQHYAEKDLWGDSTPVVTLLAAATRTIKIGSGGVMLGVNAAAQIASAYRFLANVFPGRIELGVARAMPEPGMRAELEADLSTRLAFDDHLSRLIRLLGSDALPPHGGHRVPVWLLGTGTRSAELARTFELNYAHSAMFHGTAPIADLPELAGRLAVAYFVMVAESRAEAEELVARSQFAANQRTIAGTAGECVDELRDEAARAGATDVLMCLLGPVTERIARMRALAAALAHDPRTLAAQATS